MGTLWSIECFLGSGTGLNCLSRSPDPGKPDTHHGTDKYRQCQKCQPWQVHKKRANNDSHQEVEPQDKCRKV